MPYLFLVKFQFCRSLKGSCWPKKVSIMGTIITAKIKEPIPGPISGPLLFSPIIESDNNKSGMTLKTIKKDKA